MVQQHLVQIHAQLPRRRQNAFTIQYDAAFADAQSVGDEPGGEAVEAEEVRGELDGDGALVFAACATEGGDVMEAVDDVVEGFLGYAGRT